MESRLRVSVKVDHETARIIREENIDVDAAVKALLECYGSKKKCSAISVIVSQP